MSSTSSEPRVRVELGPIARVTLNRPAQANALDIETGLEFQAAVDSVGRHPDVRVMVLAGAGKHFSAGGDFAFLEENTRLPRPRVVERMLSFYRHYLGVLALPVPTIAALQGSAIGAGLCLALACDIRIGARSARFGANFLRVGLHPGMGATLLLPHAVGAARAAQLLATAEVIDAERAFAIGLLGEVVADDELGRAAERVAGQIAQGAPRAARELVETLRAPLRAALPAALEREASCQADDFGSADLRAAVEAFRRGEIPVFTGR